VPDSCAKVGFMGRAINDIIQTGHQRSPVAMVTKIFAYCHNSLASVVQGRATITLGIATRSS